MRIRTLVRHLSHKKLKFCMKNILKVGNRSKNIPTKVQKSFWKAKNQVNLLVFVYFHASGARLRIHNIAYFFLTQGCCWAGAAGDCEHPPGEWAGPGRPPARPLITAAQPGIFSNLHPCNRFFWASRIRDYFVDPGIEIFPSRSKKDCFLHYFDFWITWYL